jgi:hypothetical protein
MSDLFGGEKAEQFNALNDAFKKSAKDRGEDSVYDFIEDTPKTTLIVTLVQSLWELGFEIKKI